MKSFHRYRKNICKRERCHWAPIKKRKLFDHSFEVAYDQEASSESVSNLPEKEMTGDKSSSASILHKGPLSHLELEFLLSCSLPI